MDVTVAEAKRRFAELVRAAGAGTQVMITRRGKPVAQLTPAPRRHVQFGRMKDRIKLYPGWDDPIDLDRFLAGDL
jgi:prevent-host-death family protein